MTDFQREYRDSDPLIDQVCDWIAQKWTTSMVAFQLREMLKDPELKSSTVKNLIKSARARIVERYHIPVEEYKGEQIAWYELVMRGYHKSGEFGNGVPAKMCDRLRAAERLDALLNLENVTNDDPAEQAKKIHEFLRAAEATVGQETDKESSDANTDKSQSDADTSDTDNKLNKNEEQGDGKETEPKSG
jgi:hypothetical protein